MKSDIALPWYITLLDKQAHGDLFYRLVSEFDLSSNDESRSRVRWYENKAGVSVVVRRGKVHAILFFSSENPNFSGYLGPLPLDLSFAMSREDVRARLGEPSRVIPPLMEGSLSHSGIERYDARVCSIVITYSRMSNRLEILGFELAE